MESGGASHFALLENQCSFCGSASVQVQCAGCQLVQYCGDEHQYLDRDTHEAACSRIRTTREVLELERAALEVRPGDFLTPADMFNSGAGRF